MDAVKAKAEITPLSSSSQSATPMNRFRNCWIKGLATQLDPETYEYDRFNIMKLGTTYNMIMGGMSMM